MVRMRSGTDKRRSRRSHLRCRFKKQVARPEASPFLSTSSSAPASFSDGDPSKLLVCAVYLPRCYRTLLDCTASDVRFRCGMFQLYKRRIGTMKFVRCLIQERINHTTADSGMGAAMRSRQAYAVVCMHHCGAYLSAVP